MPLERRGDLVVGRIGFQRLIEARYCRLRVARVEQILRFLCEEGRLLARRLRELRALVDGDRGLGPRLGRRVRLLGRLPSGCIRGNAGVLREGIAGTDEVLRIPAKLAEALVERGARLIV